MADVFISYKRADRRYAEALHAYLTARGFSTWWDTRLVAGENFNAAVQRELKNARCVVVLWTESSHASQWVQAEAIQAFERKILVAARLDDVGLDYPFGLVQTADLRGWRADAEEPRLDEVLSGVELKVGRKARAGLPVAPAPAPLTEPTAASPLPAPTRAIGDAFASAGALAGRHWRKLAGGGVAVALAVAGFIAWRSGLLPLFGPQTVPISRIYAGDGGAVAQSNTSNGEFVGFAEGDQYIAAMPFLREVSRTLPAEAEGLRGGGYTIYSTMDTRLQLGAASTMFEAASAYDRRHAWRGPISRGDAQGDIRAQLANVAPPPPLSQWQRAMVTSAQGAISVTDEQGRTGRVISADATWAAQNRNTAAALTAGAIVYVERANSGSYALKQIPEIQGALVAMDPHTGRVLALIQGLDVSDARLNRATEQPHTPGFAFTPVVFAAALEWSGAHGPITPATLIDDGPLAIEAGDGTNWSPENYTRDYYGPTPMRRAFELARPSVAARLGYEIGLDRVSQYAMRLGIYDSPLSAVQMTLGSRPTTLLQLTNGYAQFVNGGSSVRPFLIERIQDREGATIFRRDRRECPGCNDAWNGQAAPSLADTRQRVLDAVTAYQIVSMSEGVVLRGAGTAANDLGFPLAGQSNGDSQESWFIGYAPDLVVGVWFGFDDGRAVGEPANRLAAAAFRDFMQIALRDVGPTPFRIVPGARLVRIDRLTGQLPSASSQETIIEAFRPGTEPTREAGNSPFIFGTDPDLLPPGASPPQPRQEKQDEGLGGLF